MISSILLFLGATDTLAETVIADSTATIHGRIISSEGGTPLASASVLLHLPDDRGLAASTISNPSGHFRLRGLRPGSYRFEISFISYSPLIHELTLGPGEALDLGTLTLQVEAIELDEVTAAIERPQAIFAPDRDIYSVESLAPAEGGVVTELIAGIPELEIDFDGMITHRGRTPRVHINGRPAPLSGDALASFLAQFPAERIERIEIISNPSARYSAEGSGGIVNIVLREGVDLGASGGIFTNADTRGSIGIGGQGVIQRGQWLVSGGGSVRSSDQETTGYDLRQNLRDQPNTYLRQDSWSDRDQLSGDLNLNIEYRLGERSHLRGRTSYSGSDSDADGSMTTTRMDHLEVPTQRYARLSTSGSDRRDLNLMLGFSHHFTPDRQLLDIELTGRDSRSRNDRRVETEFEILGANDILRPADLTLEDAIGEGRELSLHVDYRHPWGEAGQLEIGYHAALESRDDERILEELEVGPDSHLTRATLRGYAYDQSSQSGYLTLARRIGPLGAQVGVRARWLETEFEVPTGVGLERVGFMRSGLDLFPSANLTYEFSQGRRLRLSYSRRTERPPPSHLNPIDQSTDPLNRSVGNPDLEPQYTHSFDLDLSASRSWGMLRLSPYYRRITNDWARIQTIDTAGVSTRSWENLASQDQYGASLTASMRARGGWGGFVSLDTRGERRDARNLTSIISERSFYWSIRGNIMGQILNGLGLLANISYTPAHTVAQGRMGSRIGSSIGLRQRLLAGRLSVSLTAQDPLGISRSSFENRDPTFIQLGRSVMTSRSVRLSLNYNLGAGGGWRGGRGRGGGGVGRR